jgi:hypothetical protein
VFRFSVELHHEEPNFFSNLYEKQKHRYERYKNMMENADFHRFRNILAGTAQQLEKAEDAAKATAHSVYESIGSIGIIQQPALLLSTTTTSVGNILAGTAQQLEKAEDAAMATAHSMYESIIQPGSSMDKQLAAFSQATRDQLTEAWNSVKGMKERFETAKFLSAQRQALVQQLRGNRAMLMRMREMSYAHSAKQMAALMRKITECNDALERTEGRAREAFVRATGILSLTGKKLKLPFLSRKEPQRYAKYSSDPLLGIATYPLGFHILVLGLTEIPLRVMMSNRGFERRCVGPVAYYFHPGTDQTDETFADMAADSPPQGVDESSCSSRNIPIVFVHGIGIGLIPYVPLIDYLLKTGRPILLPEIPYVSGFRPWQSPNSVLSPAVVTSTVSFADMHESLYFGWKCTNW